MSRPNQLRTRCRVMLVMNIGNSLVNSFSIYKRINLFISPTLQAIKVCNFNLIESVA